MLKRTQSEELVKIFEKACEGMAEKGYKDYDFCGMEWDDERDKWEVTFFTEHGSISFVVVCVTPANNGYQIS
ncbi:hypothetical protein H6G93_26865 [Nostoc sp. FACHB-973]|uniref:hypothetical protein n=1 Tax=Nostoc sp. KVJ20 TaxID=457944 RepID=UPI00114C9FDE|nr:hypothetical protein [Nostoc sp. KVJ20]MBD2518526.1 hypothetical protein [Nostoc sp. FACHB-973]